MSEKEEDLVVLTDENGEEHRFEVLDVLEVEGKDYAVLGSPDNDEEAIVLRIETDQDGRDVLVDIEDDDEWERVSTAWEDLQDSWDEEDGDPEENEEETQPGG